MRDKIPVEPLSSERVARVQGAVLAAYRATAQAPKRERARWAWMRFAVPMVAAAAAAILVWFARGPGVDRSLRAAEIAALQAPMRVLSDPQGASIELDGASVRTGLGTELEVHRAQGGIQLALLRGTVDCEVEPRGERPPFVVDAGPVKVVVVGTAFRVERTGDQVRVTVTRGKVRVEAVTGSTLVAAGESWAAGELRTASVDASSLREGRAAAGRDQDGAAAIAPAPTGPTNSEPRSESRTLEAATRASKSRSGSRAGKRRDHRAKHRAAAQPRSTSPRAATGFAGVGAPVSAKGDIHAVGGTTRLSVYSQAWVSFFRERDARAALARLKYFERRFTKGHYSQDALKLRIRIQCRRASSACRKAAHRYLDQYPSGDYRDQARTLTNWM